MEKGGWVGQTGELVRVVGGGDRGELRLAMQEMLEKGVEPGAGDWGLGGVVDVAEGESLVRLDRDCSWGAVCPEVGGVRGGGWVGGRL